MINATVFGSTTSSVQWKAVTTSTSGSAPAVFKPSGGSADSVSVSKLGQALSGVAADAFKHLDAKARGALEGLVNTGQISADDAVLGLRSLATTAAFSRYTQERPKDDEDKQRLVANETAWKNFQASSVKQGNARAEFGRAFADLQAKQERGEISMEDFQKNIAPAQKKFDDDLASIHMDAADLTNDGGFSKTFKGFETAMSSLKTDNGFLALSDESGNAAQQKLAALKFDSSVFGNAFKDFAATVDIPGIGRAAGAAAPPAEPQEPVAEASAPAATPVDTVLTAAKATEPKPDSPAAKTAKPAADPSNAQQAAAMLKSALEGGGKKTTGLFDSVSDKGGDASDSVLNSLVESLKAGAGKDKTDAASSS